AYIFAYRFQGTSSVLRIRVPPAISSQLCAYDPFLLDFPQANLLGTADRHPVGQYQGANAFRAKSRKLDPHCNEIVLVFDEGVLDSDLQIGYDNMGTFPTQYITFFFDSAIFFGR
ncbi:MAG TPA: hypothetical protein VLE49_17905, partial [Anaerolineales bacterium]|nr:hypothetical protein [Anaerolineales bacterium]